MARTFELGMRAAIRSNCGSTIEKLKEATKAPLLYMFKVHSHCHESFCYVKRKEKNCCGCFSFLKPSALVKSHSQIHPDVIPWNTTKSKLKRIHCVY